MAGFPSLLQGGKRATLGTSTPNPRTAVGLDSKRDTLILVVAEGRHVDLGAAAYVEGLTLAQMPAIMEKAGASEAVNLDGGGSSNLVIGGKRVSQLAVDNRWDPWNEAPVANHIAVVTVP